MVLADNVIVDPLGLCIFVAVHIAETPLLQNWVIRPLCLWQVGQLANADAVAFFDEPQEPFEMAHNDPTYETASLKSCFKHSLKLVLRHVNCAL